MAAHITGAAMARDALPGFARARGGRMQHLIGAEPIRDEPLAEEVRSVAPAPVQGALEIIERRILPARFGVAGQNEAQRGCHDKSLPRAGMRGKLR